MQKFSNNFDFVRLLAATLVFLSHQHVLTGHGELLLLPGLSAGAVGVGVFFAVSGFLVTQSWMRDPHLVRFAVKRLLRIWPGLAVAVFLTVFVVGSAATSLPLGDFLSSRATYDYFNILRFKIYYVLPGVFEGNPYPRGVNGSLWTIPIEVQWYVILAFLGAVGLVRRQWFLLLIGFSIVGLAIFGPRFKSSFDRPIYELGAYFMMGILLARFEKIWRSKSYIFFGVVSVASVMFWMIGEFRLSLLFMIAYSSVIFGSSKLPVFRSFGRFGDFSYGLYIYAFPVQQFVVFCLFDRIDSLTLAALAYVVTLILAGLSWHFVESPALRLKPSR